MKTAEEIAQWVINNRYAKSDFELYHTIITDITKRIDNSCKEELSQIELIIDHGLSDTLLDYIQEKINYLNNK